MKASKKKLKESEDEQIVQEMCILVGERRIRDLLDLISDIESKSGWYNVVEYLLQSSKLEYPIPVGLSSNTTRLEPIKYREVIFGLFGCSGIEPIDLDTEMILSTVSKSDSFVDAQSLFRSIAESSALASISEGDTLFFDSSFLHSDVSAMTQTTIEQAHEQIIKHLELEFHDNEIHIFPLWYSEPGRAILSELGIDKAWISREEFDIVLSVLQVSDESKKKLTKSLDKENHDQFVPPKISNPMYNDLLDAIISSDIDTLEKLGSRHACPTLNFKLREYVDEYKATKQSSYYRGLLKLLRSHIAIRSIESIPAISELADIQDDRILNDVIRALGNFYHESAVSTLLVIFCKSEKREIRKSILNIILHQKTRCPETKGVVLDMLRRECNHVDDLRTFYHRTW